MSWLFIALLAPALWAATNYIDKYLLDRYFQVKSAGILVFISGLIGVVALPVIFIFADVSIVPFSTAILLIISGILWVGGIWPYFIAMSKTEASIAVPLFQVVPVIGFVLAFIFLGETLSGKQAPGSFLIIGGAVGLTLEFKKDFKFRHYFVHIFSPNMQRES